MAENNAPTTGANGDVPAGVPFYEKSRQHLKELLARKRMLERTLVSSRAPHHCPAPLPGPHDGRAGGRFPVLFAQRGKTANEPDACEQAAHEEAIFQKETDYLETTPSGNIITGFDAYTKGTTAAAAQRRRAGLTEQNRVFSRSSVSYGANGGGDGGSATPGGGSTPASHAPTPVSTSFANLKDKDKDKESGGGTPTSATAGGNKGGGGGGGGGGSKKEKASKKSAAAANAPVGEDSETDAKETKKVRTNFGAVRK